MMTALTVGLRVAVGLLIVRIRKITQDQESLGQRLNSISLTPGWIRVADDDGSEVNIRGGSLWLRGPHGDAGPQLTLRTVPGTADSYPYDHFDGRVSREKRVTRGAALRSPSTPRRFRTCRYLHASDLSSAMTPSRFERGRPRSKPRSGRSETGTWSLSENFSPR